MDPKEIEKTLFDVYQSKLEWINRRLQPDTLEFYKEDPETWKHAKEVAFSMYQSLRGLLSGEYPDLWDSVDREAGKDIPPYSILEAKFECVGVLTYRDEKFPVYYDDYGMSAFVVSGDSVIEVDSFAGETDWYYALDRIIDGI